MFFLKVISDRIQVHMASFDISQEAVERFASLARIQLSEKERAALTKDLAAILEYVRQVSGVADIAPPALPGNRNVFRDDGEPHPSGAETEALLAEAPAVEEGFLKVKKILSRT